MQTIQVIDEKIVLFFQSIRVEILTAFFSIFIRLEFWNVIGLILVLYFLVRTKTFRAPVISYVLAWYGTKLSYSLLKDYFHRPRPFAANKAIMAAIHHPQGFSFPSGHATMAAAMAVVLTYHFPKSRYLVFSLALLAGLSRVYFGVHYLTDILGGFALGTIVGILSLIAEKIILSINKT